jgi:hypothetical protein
LQQFYDQVETEAMASTGVASVAFTSAPPLDYFDDGGYSYEIAGDAPLNDADRPLTETQSVSWTYFSTLDLPIVAGREFAASDGRGRKPVCIVNESI